MPLSLAKLAKNIASVTFSYEGESLTVTYYPARVTEKVFAELQSFATMDEKSFMAGFASLNKILIALIQSWDMYEDEDETVMYPLEPDRLSELPIDLRVQIANAIISDIRPEAVAPHLNGHS
jgi:hypothetical protein